MIAVVQSISIISPLNPATAIAPLAFVIAVSMIREAIEDYIRYRSDKGKYKILVNLDKLNISELPKIKTYEQSVRL